MSESPASPQYKEISPEPFQGCYARTSSILGRGATKVVFQGVDLRTDTGVAWNKISLAELDKEEQIRVVEEANLLSQQHHPQLINCFASWKTQDEMVLITELVQAGSLKRYVETHWINLKLCKHIACQILQALKYLHEQQPPIVHRDIKCDNVLYDPEHELARVGDLGLSTQLTRNGSHRGSFMGTPQFMAPELYEENYDETVDVYSFGLTMLELAARGELPYAECSNQAQIYKKVISGVVPDLLNRVQHQGLREFVEFCILKRPDGTRPSAAKALQHPFLRDEASNDDNLLSDSLISLPEVNTMTQPPGHREADMRTDGRTSIAESDTESVVVKERMTEQDDSDTDSEDETLSTQISDVVQQTASVDDSFSGSNTHTKHRRRKDIHGRTSFRPHATSQTTMYGEIEPTSTHSAPAAPPEEQAPSMELPGPHSNRQPNNFDAAVRTLANKNQSLRITEDQTGYTNSGSSVPTEIGRAISHDADIPLSTLYGRLANGLTPGSVSRVNTGVVDVLTDVDMHMLGGNFGPAGNSVSSPDLPSGRTTGLSDAWLSNGFTTPTLSGGTALLTPAAAGAAAAGVAAAYMAAAEHGPSTDTAAESQQEPVTTRQESQEGPIKELCLVIEYDLLETSEVKRARVTFVYDVREPPEDAARTIVSSLIDAENLIIDDSATEMFSAFLNTLRFGPLVTLYTTGVSKWHWRSITLGPSASVDAALKAGALVLQSSSSISHTEAEAAYAAAAFASTAAAAIPQAERGGVQLPPPQPTPSKVQRSLRSDLDASQAPVASQNSGGSTSSLTSNHEVSSMPTLCGRSDASEDEETPSVISAPAAILPVNHHEFSQPMMANLIAEHTSHVSHAPNDVHQSNNDVQSHIDSTVLSATVPAVQMMTMLNREPLPVDVGDDDYIPEVETQLTSQSAPSMPASTRHGGIIPEAAAQMASPESAPPAVNPEAKESAVNDDFVHMDSEQIQGDQTNLEVSKNPSADNIEYSTADVPTVAPMSQPSVVSAVLPQNSAPTSSSSYPLPVNSPPPTIPAPTESIEPAASLGSSQISATASGISTVSSNLISTSNSSTSVTHGNVSESLPSQLQENSQTAEDESHNTVPTLPDHQTTGASEQSAQHPSSQSEEHANDGKPPIHPPLVDPLPQGPTDESQSPLTIPVVSVGIAMTTSVVSVTTAASSQLSSNTQSNSAPSTPHSKAHHHGVDISDDSTGSIQRDNLVADSRNDVANGLPLSTNTGTLSPNDLVKDKGKGSDTLTEQKSSTDQRSSRASSSESDNLIDEKINVLLSGDMGLRENGSSSRTDNVSARGIGTSIGPGNVVNTPVSGHVSNVASYSLPSQIPHNASMDMAAPDIGVAGSSTLLGPARRLQQPLSVDIPSPTTSKQVVTTTEPSRAVNMKYFQMNSARATVPIAPPVVPTVSLPSTPANALLWDADELNLIGESMGGTVSGTHSFNISGDSNGSPSVTTSPLHRQTGRQSAGVPVKPRWETLPRTNSMVNARVSNPMGGSSMSNKISSGSSPVGPNMSPRLQRSSTPVSVSGPGLAGLGFTCSPVARPANAPTASIPVHEENMRGMRARAGTQVSVIQAQPARDGPLTDIYRPVGFSLQNDAVQSSNTTWPAIAAPQTNQMQQPAPSTSLNAYSYNGGSSADSVVSISSRQSSTGLESSTYSTPPKPLSGRSSMVQMPIVSPDRSRQRLVVAGSPTTPRRSHL